MFVKTAVLLSAPLLAAAASEAVVAASRMEKRAALLELLKHDHTRRAESYGGPTPPICTPQTGENQATFNQVPTGVALAAPLNSFTYAIDPSTASCFTLANCQSACIGAGGNCVGIVYTSSPVGCTLLGYSSSYTSGQVVAAVDPTYLLANAGTTNPSTGQAETTVPTCATTGGLDTALPNGSCQCGSGRHPATAYTCEADPVPAGTIDPAKPVTTISQPVSFSSPITWSDPFSAVPAVMTGAQCATICAADDNCQAFLVVVGQELSDCYLIGGNGVYPSPAGFPISSSARKVRRQAAGQTGAIGGAGDVYGQKASSTLVNNAYAASSTVPRMRVRRAHQSQGMW